MISILILTKNEEQDLPGCLESVSWSDDIHVFDSFSDDKTVAIAENAGATITQRVFDNWSAHQNWGLANIKFKYPWVLYIDADERVSESLLNAIKTLKPDVNSGFVAYELQRRDFAWNGRWLKHAQMSPFYLRLFRPEKMHYERLVNPVSVPDGPVGKIEGFLDHYPFSKGFKFWIQRHLSYADMEALTRVKDLDNGAVFSFRKALFGKDFTEKRFHQKGLFYKLPGRPMIKWFYMVIVRRAFLDGSAGVTYATLQSIYEYFIVLKSKELLSQKKK
ncbi:glycosyltransferase family 2 protein [Flavobacterium piscis]|uniref:Glycosyltransferase involved in cell wall biosynthesis n=1 Tax=Flavobacterium piscis TaxID=1114874 RepID=A0ABU1Y8V3_9FLAO|nr:glycosyltransferase family 2 protein [Flavobacterium piscis]MDR7210667.1 glycosyltransferase involved in cell wall biosynthesis [Flavobacterium piscis]